MTFRRPETNPKDSCDDRRHPSDGDRRSAQQHTAANISTIYDPRQQCNRHPISAPKTTIPVSSPEHKLPPLYNPKKSLVEKIKKISHKLYSAEHSSHCAQLDEAHQRRMRAIKYVCLAVLLTSYIAVMVCAWIFMYGPIQKPDHRNFIVDGEFQIMDRDFEPAMLDKESPVFKNLAFNISYELNRLFKRNDRDMKVAECYQRNEVLEITPTMTVKSIIGFKHCGNYLNVGRIGLAFLRSLRLKHGHTYMGHHVINVQSIGFTVRGEEGVWSEWTDWRGCESSSDTVAKRTRRCLTRDTNQVTNVDRCLLIPGNKGDLDILPCSKYRQMLQEREKEELNKDLFDGDYQDHECGTAIREVLQQTVHRLLQNAELFIAGTPLGLPMEPYHHLFRTSNSSSKSKHSPPHPPSTGIIHPPMPLIHRPMGMFNFPMGRGKG